MKTTCSVFRINPLAAALAMALVALPAGAATLTSANVPVNGTVVVGAATAAVTGATGDFGGPSIATGNLAVTISSTLAVVTWGVAGTTTASLNASPTYSGFNLNNKSQLTVDGAVGSTLLNVDVTGQASTINGTVANVLNPVNVYVANANGIIVGSTANFAGVAGAVGLLAANVPDYASLSSTASAIGVDFSTGGSLSVADGAKLAVTTILAGAGTVNVTDTAAINSGMNLTIVGGTAGSIAGNAFATGTTANLTLATTNATVALTNAAGTAVNLNLGHLTTGTQAALPFVNGGSVYASGDINNSGDLSANGLAWGGTLTNSGVLSQGVVGTSTTNAAVANNVTNTGTLNLSTLNIAGSLNNSGTLGSTGSMTLNTGTDVTNTGSITLGSTTATPVDFTVSAGGNFSNTGAIALVTTTNGASNVNIGAGSSATLGGTLTAATLDGFTLSAGVTPGNTASVNTAVAAAGSVSLSGFNVGVGANVMSAANVGVTVGANGASPTAGVLTVASGATLAASTTGTMAIDSASSLSASNLAIDGTISAGTINIGDFGTINSVEVPGNVMTNQLLIDAVGNVNKTAGGGTAALNYLDNAATITALNTSAPVTVVLDADGTHAQLWNLKVVGNAQLESSTANFTQVGVNNGGTSSAFYRPATNALSQLRVQATGDMYISSSAASLESGETLGVSGIHTNDFQWPGLTVLIAAGDLVSNVAIDNALGGSIPGGNGIFLQGNTLQLNAPVYTSGNAWINFEQTGFGTATMNSPLGMTAYYVTAEPSNTSTGVNSYVPVSAPSGQLKLGRSFVTGYVPR